MKGFIAITTSIILSFLVLTVAAALGFSAFFSRANNSGFYYKKTSQFISRSCLDYALLKLAENGNYAGNETRTIDSYQCSLQPMETSGSNKIIKAHSQVNGATTNLKLTVNGATLSTVSLEELVSF